MRHRRFYVTSLAIDGRRIPSRGGDLIVAQRGESPELDWELVHQSSEIVSIENAAYTVHIGGPEGDFAGSALFVRSDGRSHVFRGAGVLDGFDLDSFDVAAGDQGEGGEAPDVGEV